MPIEYDGFDVGNAVSSGGVTGSTRVKMGNKNYQLKPSILDNEFTRQLKAGWTDRENYGEVIASKVSRAILITSDFEAAPNVSLVYDKVSKKTPVASKYLEGDKVRTLDEYIQEKDPRIKPKRHVKFVDGTKGKVGKGEYDISGEKNASLRKDIAMGIAGSIISGDHDVNPGNMIVVTKDGKDRVARIDFGHAFNDLLNAPKMFGGKVRNKDNQVLDFLNRENLADLRFGDQPKLWRDYPGMIPSQEMADAFKELSEAQGLKSGVNAAREEFTDLLIEMEKNNDKKGIKHLQKSLEAISNNVSEVPLNPKLTPQQSIAVAFDNIEKFAKDNQNQMKDAAKLMQLQVDIDKVIEGKKKGVEPSKEQMSQLKNQYAELEKIKGIGQKGGGIEWIKTDEKKPAHKGDLESYIKQRGQKLGLNKAQSKDLAHSDFEFPVKPTFLQRVYNKLFGDKAQEAKPQAVVTSLAKTQGNKILGDKQISSINKEVPSASQQIPPKLVAKAQVIGSSLGKAENNKPIIKPKVTRNRSASVGW